MHRVLARFVTEQAPRTDPSPAVAIRRSLVYPCSEPWTSRHSGAQRARQLLSGWGGPENFLFFHVNIARTPVQTTVVVLLTAGKFTSVSYAS